MKKLLLALSVVCAASTAGLAQFSENFESTTGTALPAGWSQTVAVGTPNDSVGWNSGTNTTLGSTEFPMYPHTRYIAVNDDKKQFANNSNSLVMTPTFSLGAGSWWLKFECAYLHRTYSGNTETATVEVTTNGGATWTVVSTLAANVTYWWETRYIDMSAYAGMSNIQIGFRYRDASGWLYGWGIDDISVFSPPSNDIALTAIAPTTGSPNSYATGGSNITVIGQVFNNGASTISSYNVKYIFNGGSVVTNAVTGVSIAPFTSATFTATTPVTMPTAVGPYQLKVWAELAGDPNATNDSAAMDTLNTVSFMPVKVLAFEEGTGTWCQWCPRGAVYMDSLHTLYGDGVSLVAVHNSTSDPMQLPAYDALISSKVSGYPSVLVDRRLSIDPSQALDAYTAMHDDFGFATVGATPTLTGSNLSVAVTVKPALNLTNAKLALVITEDEVSGTGAGWSQANAYSGSTTTFLTGGGVNYNLLPNPIPASQMKYEFVARSIDPSPTGGSGLLPASMTYGTDYNYTFTKTLTSSWVTNKLHGIVLLLDGANGAVLNSKNFSLTVGISDVKAGVENFIIRPNPASTQATLVFDLKNKENVQIEVYDMLGRSVYAAPATMMNAGTVRVDIPLSNLATGMYNVKVQTENGTIVEKLNVVK